MWTIDIRYKVENRIQNESQSGSLTPSLVTLRVGFLVEEQEMWITALNEELIHMIELNRRIPSEPAGTAPFGTYIGTFENIIFDFCAIDLEPCGDHIEQISIAFVEMRSLLFAFIAQALL